MSPSTELPMCGPWTAIKLLGRGGQGNVYLAKRQLEKDVEAAQIDQLVSSHQVLGAIRTRNEMAQVAEGLFRVLYARRQHEDAPRVALKVLHEFETEAERLKALGRMNKELEVLRGTAHPALVRVLDADLDQGWFVMEYFEGGTLAEHLERTKGDLLNSLVAFRPLVEAVAQLHANKIVHRDIKPENVFVASDGHLVLGDCGLAIDLEDHKGRLTDTYENVGSRDWMPRWGMTVRLDQVRPTFDMFSLGKLLWAMISGKPRLRLWDHHDPEFELEHMFPENPSIRFVRLMLDKCIVEREEQCTFRTAAELLKEVDHLIEALRHGAQALNTSAPHRCWVCGVGAYAETEPLVSNATTLVCNHCGHVQTFYQTEKRLAWKHPPLIEDAKDETELPLPFLQLVEHTGPGWLGVLLSNEDTTPLQEVELVLQDCQAWNQRRRQFNQNPFQSVTLLKGASVLAGMTNSSVVQIALMKARDRPLAIKGIAQEVAQESIWRITLVASSGGRSRRYEKFFHWAPGHRPEFTTNPSSAGPEA